MRRLRRYAALPRRALAYSSSQRRASDGPPIFIVGCPRSGTTVMREILDSHSRIACPGETWFLAGLFEQLRNPFFIRGLASLGIQREEAVANIREFALNNFERFLYREGKARWADKTPGYVDYAPQIFAVFGDVRFVFLMRHGLDVVNSMHDHQEIDGVKWFDHLLSAVSEQGGGLGSGGAGGDRLSRLKMAARMWIRHNENFHAFMAKHPSLCHVVRYEDLTTRPEPVVRGVLEFLGEPWEPRILDYQSFPHSGLGDPEVRKFESIQPNSGNYRSWPPEEQATIRELLAGHLQRYSYTDTAATGA